MIFRTAVRDCLYLNWALPRAALPPLAEPLRYDVAPWRGDPYVFASAALFRLRGLHLQSVPLLRLSHPQFILRLCILDADGMPAFYACAVLIPTWAVPAARLVARQPARGGVFDYPRDGCRAGRAHYEVRRRGALAFAAEAASPMLGAGPELGSWDRSVAYFLRRRRGYFLSRGGVRRVELSERQSQAVPLAVDIRDDELLGECLPRGDGEPWPSLHSAWMCPEESFVFELGRVQEGPLPRQVPAPG